VATNSTPIHNSLIAVQSTSETLTLKHIEKGEVVLVHAMKAYRRNWSTAPIILNL